jgi:hypothetical protein
MNTANIAIQIPGTPTIMHIEVTRNEDGVVTINTTHPRNIITTIDGTQLNANEYPFQLTDNGYVPA